VSPAVSSSLQPARLPLQENKPFAVFWLAVNLQSFPRSSLLEKFGLVKLSAISHAGLINEAKTATRNQSTVGLVLFSSFLLENERYALGVCSTTETLTHSVGPGLGLLILALVPLRMAPCAGMRLIVAKARQQCCQRRRLLFAGSIGAFGASGFSKWVAHVDVFLVDMAIYPVLFNQLFTLFHPRGWTREWGNGSCSLA